MIDAGDIQKPQAVDTNQMPLPEFFGKRKILEAPEEQLLLEQWQEFNRLRSLPVTGNPLLERASMGKPEFIQGTLLHGFRYSAEKMKSIKKTGILSGEFVDPKFIGELEDETNYCGDFFRVPKDMTIKEYQEWITETERLGFLRSPRAERNRLAMPNTLVGSKPPKVVSLIVDSQQPELQTLLQQDAYSESADPRLRRIVNRLLGPKGDSQTRRLAAILCGVPSNFINGVIISPSMTTEDIAELRTIFGNNVTIYSSNGELLK